MIKEKLYDFDTSYKVNYFFDLCKQKNEFLELLKTSKPVRVKNSSPMAQNGISAVITILTFTSFMSMAG